MRLILIGHAPPWAAFFLWLVVIAAAAALTRAVVRQADRERRDRTQRRRQLDHQFRDLYEQLDHLDDRLRVMEDHLFPREPPEDYRWRNSPPNR